MAGTPEQIAQKIAVDNMKKAGIETPPAQVDAQDEPTPPVEVPPAAATPNLDDAGTEPVVQPTTTLPDMIPRDEYLRLRNEAATNRKKYQALQEEQKKAKREAELATMTETTRLEAEKNDLVAENAQLRERQAYMAKETALINAATDAGFEYPADVAGIVDKNVIDVLDDGRIDLEQVRMQVQHLAETRKHWLRVEQKPLGNVGLPTNPPPSTGPTVKRVVTGQDVDRKMVEAQNLMVQGNTRMAVKAYNEAWERSPELRSGFPFKGVNKES